LKLKNFLLLAFFASAIPLFGASESKDGRIRLVLNDRNGSFALYYMADASERRYEPFLNANDPTTSFIAVETDGKVYRLGESRSFKTSTDRIGSDPAIVFESSFLKVTETFSLIKTPNSLAANGVKITINVENKSARESSVAVRVLLDTILGEGIGKVPFIISGEGVRGEIIIKNNTDNKYWITRDKNMSIMGSIELPNPEDGKNPDFVHFANWKKLNDAIWKAVYYEGKSFNYTPYSTNDTAVCYYYEPEKLKPGESFKMAIYLSTEDKDGFVPAFDAALNDAAIAGEHVSNVIEKYINDKNNDINEQMILMRRYKETLDKFIAGEIVLSDAELLEIDNDLTRIKNRYNLF